MPHEERKKSTAKNNKNSDGNWVGLLFMVTIMFMCALELIMGLTIYIDAKEKFILTDIISVYEFSGCLIVIEGTIVLISTLTRLAMVFVSSTQEEEEIGSGNASLNTCRSRTKSYTHMIMIFAAYSSISYSMFILCFQSIEDKLKSHYEQLNENNSNQLHKVNAKYHCCGFESPQTFISDMIKLNLASLADPVNLCNRTNLVS